MEEFVWFLYYALHLKYLFEISNISNSSATEALVKDPVYWLPILQYPPKLSIASSFSNFVLNMVSGVLIVLSVSHGAGWDSFRSVSATKTLRTILNDSWKWSDVSLISSRSDLKLICQLNYFKFSRNFSGRSLQYSYLANVIVVSSSGINPVCSCIWQILIPVAFPCVITPPNIFLAW